MKTKPYTMMLMMLAGWMNRQQQEVVDYLKAENRILIAAPQNKGLVFL